MIPKEKDWAKHMNKLGLTKNDIIVIYDEYNNCGACRVWWMFTAYDFPNVYLLNGNFGKWVNEGRPLETSEVKHILESWLVE